MKTYNECLEQLAQDNGYISWKDLIENENFRTFAQCHERAAKKVAEETINKCVENAKTKDHYNRGWHTTYIDTDSIRNTEIILP